MRDVHSLRGIHLTAITVCTCFRVAHHRRWHRPPLSHLSWTPDHLGPLHLFSFSCSVGSFIYDCAQQGLIEFRMFCVSTHQYFRACLHLCWLLPSWLSWKRIRLQCRKRLCLHLGRQNSHLHFSKEAILSSILQMKKLRSREVRMRIKWGLYM